MNCNHASIWAVGCYWDHPVATQPWICLSFLPDCRVTGAEDSANGISPCWHPPRPRMWSQRKPLIRLNKQLTDQMALPLLDFLCCLCTFSFIFFLMLVYIQLHIKPPSLLQAIQFGSTEYHSENGVENSVCCSESWASFFSFGNHAFKMAFLYKFYLSRYFCLRTELRIGEGGLWIKYISCLWKKKNKQTLSCTVVKMNFALWETG